MLPSSYLKDSNTQVSQLWQALGVDSKKNVEFDGKQSSSLMEGGRTRSRFFFSFVRLELLLASAVVAGLHAGDRSSWYVTIGVG